MTLTTELAEELLDLAVRTARSAARLVESGAARGVEVADTKSSAVDVVTESDRSSERLIRRTLLDARPGDAVLGEEGQGEQSDRPGTSGVRWIVDPIDGTVNFLYGIPQYAVSIAAELDGEVVAGVVLNVATGTEYTATLGGPALRDGLPIRVRAVVPLAERLIGTGFSYEAHQREVQAASLLRLLPRIRDIRRLGSCALDLCGVAQGSLDGYLEEGVNVWDHAAGGLVARSAGARVETLPGVGGRPIVVAAPAGGFEEFLTAITQAGYLAAPGA
ncbi:MAG TPA: inositol monophosphatase [Nocardioides bacterium]|uniref:inositol monophosphatase family protein n=1 Tax=uncultured Nocardioides sp. TaxID=198441 RepID=UPI000EEE224D|nr:inositol monophosphatase family protein [uncultured Nocardioides sp.]HCB05683.1 inositol monophosphatase [Nocardioides sp.]HRD61341.1 inositol monophosphatase family protein [Nocardioides sp.]